MLTNTLESSVVEYRFILEPHQMTVIVPLMITVSCRVQSTRDVS